MVLIVRFPFLVGTGIGNRRSYDGVHMLCRHCCRQKTKVRVANFNATNFQTW
jgi:hypothetical protein